MHDLAPLWSKEPITRADALLLAAQVKALADPSRLQLLSILFAARPAELTVTDLIDALGTLSQATVSHHLRLLEDAAYVSHRRDGMFMRYRALPQAVTDVANLLRRPGLLRTP